MINFSASRGTCRADPLHDANRLEILLESTRTGTWEWNVQTDEFIPDERWAEITGFALSDLTPASIETWRSMVHPDDRTRSEAAMREHLGGKVPHYDVEVRARHKAGHGVWVRDWGRIVTRTGEGRPEWIYGTRVSLEIERRRLADKHLMERLLDRTGRVAGVGGWQIDLKTDELIWTNETRRIHGVGEDYVPTVEKGVAFYPPKAREVITRAVYQGIEFGTPWNLELPFVQATGEQIWVRAVGEVEFEDGKARRIFGTLQDITNQIRQTEELTSALAALKASNQELDQFAYIASHDLRAPLRVIMNAATWLEEDIGAQVDEDSRENLALLMSRAARMENLLDSLLQYSRVGRERLDERADISGRDMAEDIEQLLDPPEEILLDFSDAFLALRMPGMPLLTVLLNLVGNAIKHHDKPAGTITIDVERETDMLRFSVGDDGPGIEEKYRDKVFEMFTTLKPRDEVEGSGMGLAIVKKHVELNGGTVSLSSSAGAGSTIAFTWPVSISPAENTDNGK